MDVPRCVTCGRPLFPDQPAYCRRSCERDPAPAVIVERAAEIRALWTADQFWRRRYGEGLKVRRPYEFPKFAATVLTVD